MSLAVDCDECRLPVTGPVHVRAVMRVSGGMLRLDSPTLHYHEKCLLKWALRTAPDKTATAPLPAIQ